MAKQLQESAAVIKDRAPNQAVKKRKESPPSSEDEAQNNYSTVPSRPKMAMKQGPIPKKMKRESELEELLADQERKKEADKVMLWKLASDQRKEAGTLKPSRPETDYKDRLRAVIASRNDALQQSEITTQTEAAMEQYRTRAQLGRSTASASTTQSSSKSGGGGGRYKWQSYCKRRPL